MEGVGLQEEGSGRKGRKMWNVYVVEGMGLKEEVV